jgi:hypothetical protein
MIVKRTIDVYVTSDDKEFKSLKDARGHCTRLAVEIWAKEHIHGGGSLRDIVVDAIIENRQELSNILSSETHLCDF